MATCFVTVKDDGRIAITRLVGGKTPDKAMFEMSRDFLLHPTYHGVELDLWRCSCHFIHEANDGHAVMVEGVTIAVDDWVGPVHYSCVEMDESLVPVDRSQRELWRFDGHRVYVAGG